MNLTLQTMSSKGQLVIPVGMRQKLGVSAGMKVAIAMDEVEKVIKIWPMGTDVVERAVGGLQKYNVDKGTYKKLLAVKKAEVLSND